MKRKSCVRVSTTPANAGDGSFHPENFLRREFGGDALFPIRSGWRSRRYADNFRCVPRKIRQLVADLEGAGFMLVSGGKGSHRKFRHPKLAGSVILSGRNGDDAKHYQERQIRNAIRKARQ